MTGGNCFPAFAGTISLLAMTETAGIATPAKHRGGLAMTMRMNNPG